MLCKAGQWYNEKIKYSFNIKPYTASFFGFLSFHHIQVDSGQTVVQLSFSLNANNWQLVLSLRS